MTTKSMNLNIKEYLDSKRTKAVNEHENEDHLELHTPVAISGRPNDAIDFSFPQIAMKKSENQIEEIVPITVYSARAKKYSFKTMTENTVAKAVVHKTKEQVRGELPISTFTWSENRKQDRILSTLDVAEPRDTPIHTSRRSGAHSAPLRRAQTPTNSVFITEVPKGIKPEEDLLDKDIDELRKYMNSSQSRRSALEAKYARENSGLFNMLASKQNFEQNESEVITAESLLTQKRLRRKNYYAQQWENNDRRSRPGSSLEHSVHTLLTRDAEKQNLNAADGETLEQKKLRSQTLAQMAKVKTANAHNFRMREKRNTSTDYLAKMDKFRTNENERKDLEIRVAEYKALKERERVQEKQRLQAERKVIIQRNIKDVHLFSADVRKQLMNLRFKEKEEHSDFIRETKRFIDQTRIDRTMDQIQDREERQAERERQKFLVPFTQAWLTLVVIANKSENLRRLLETVQSTRMERENLEQQEMFKKGADLMMNMNGKILTAEQIKAEQDRLFKTKHAFQLFTIRRILRKPIMHWRENKRNQYRGMVVHFLNDLHETFRIPLAIKKFKRSVQMIQQNFRAHRIRTVSRLILLKKQFDAFLQARLNRIDYLMMNEDQKSGKRRLSTKKVGKKPEPEKRKAPMITNKKREFSFKNLDPVSRFKDGGENNKRFFELMAEKEELKKISEQVKIDLLRENLKTRLKEYVKMYTRYKTRLEEQQKHSTGKPAVEQAMPKFRVLLDKEDLRILMNKAWQKSKHELLKKREAFMMQSGLGGLGSGNSTVTGEILARLNVRRKSTRSPTSDESPSDEDDSPEAQSPVDRQPSEPTPPTPGSVKSLANVLLMKRRLVNMAQGARNRVQEQHDSVK